MIENILTIRLYGDPCLRKKSTPVKEIGPSERLLIQAMIETMYKHKGIGLAAPQVGINEQIFVADIGQGPFAVVNPRIIKKKGFSVVEEGCLSIPGVLVEIKRPETIVVRYIDENNRIVEREASELLARVIQHETDHLYGKLTIDYARWKDKGKINKQLQKIVDENKNK